MKKKPQNRHVTESSDSWACILPCLKCFCTCNPKTQEIQKEKFQKGIQNLCCALDVWLSYYMNIYVKPQIQTKMYVKEGICGAVQFNSRDFSLLHV